MRKSPRTFSLKMEQSHFTDSHDGFCGTSLEKLVFFFKKIVKESIKLVKEHMICHNGNFFSWMVAIVLQSYRFTIAR